jgi:hypothetical protein
MINGNVGVNTTNPSYKLQVSGSFAATTKSFDIPHPLNQEKRLVYASVEGPEHGVYIRGKSVSNIIELPNYWVNLIDENSITALITPIGKDSNGKIRNYSVLNIENNQITVYTDSLDKKYEFYYTVNAERKDVPKLIVEP